MSEIYMDNNNNDIKDSIKSYLKKKKKRKGNKIIEKRVLLPSRDVGNIEIEYIEPTLEAFGVFSQEFSNIYEKFKLEGREQHDFRDGNVEMVDEEDEHLEAEVDQEEEDKKRANEKKMKKLNRMTVAELKLIVKNPEMVEWFDVSSAEPKLLIDLKAYRNTVPVPMHWSQKRRYLQGKRGIEKAPYELPDNIKDTGISTLRNIAREKEQAKGLKGRMKEKMKPKLGKIDIDYQRLYDAFFRFQKKPSHLSTHGELYYEGKEFETRLKERRPGILSSELRDALGIHSSLVPPPWLLSMQRYGPPPSYPNLRIPGLSAPIPDGAQWGYHPGGWGKPPVDEFNRPLYGDVFGLYSQYQKQLQDSIESSHLSVPVIEQYWGEFEATVEEEEEENEDDAVIDDDMDVSKSPSV